MRHSLTILICIILCSITVFAQDWPDWRGIDRDATLDDSDLVQKFETDTLPVKWKVSLEPGYSGPSVAKGRVYITDRPAEPRDTERILCFDEESGTKLWEHSYKCIYSGVGYPAGPRASVVIEEGMAYSLGTMGNLLCLNAATGAVIWEKEMNTEYQIDMPTWGIAATPLIVDDKIILHISGSNNACIVALDKMTGKEIWRNLDEVAGYSAPILIEKGDKRVVVVWTEESIAGLDLSSGDIYWRYLWKQGAGMAIATPVLYRDYLFMSSFYSGSLLLELSDNHTKATKIWQREGESERNTDALHCVMNTPVILDDYIYGVDSYGELRCLELMTGNRVWEDKTAVKPGRWANIHFIQSETKTWMFNEQGELLITKLSPEGFVEISRSHLIEPTKKQLARGVTWSHPAFANKHVFIRNDKEMLCVDLSAK